MGKLRKRLAALTELPMDAFGACPYVTIESNTAIKLDACLEILSYDEARIRLRLSELIATVTGERMTMRSYGDRTIRITGIIRSLTLTEIGQEECQ